MAKNPLTESFKKNTLLQRTVIYGKENYSDGRTSLQHYQQFFIAQHFGIKEPLQTYFNNGYLVFIGLAQCGRLLRFFICPLGLYSISVIPVMGGNNSPYKSIVLKQTSQQLTCLKINQIPKQKTRKVKTMR